MRTVICSGRAASCWRARDVLHPQAARVFPAPFSSAGPAWLPQPAPCQQRWAASSASGEGGASPDDSTAAPQPKRRRGRPPSGGKDGQAAQPAPGTQGQVPAADDSPPGASAQQEEAGGAAGSPEGGQAAPRGRGRRPSRRSSHGQQGADEGAGPQPDAAAAAAPRPARRSSGKAGSRAAGSSSSSSDGGAAATAEAVVPPPRVVRITEPPPPSTVGRMYIIDTMAQAFRIMHGYGSNRLSTQLGEDTSLPHAMMALLVSLLRRKPPPTHMVVVVDAPGKNFRHNLWDQYKAGRPPAPPSLYDDLAKALMLVNAMGVQILSVPGYEADDVIGAVAVRAAGEGMDVTIVSPDKDFFQVLGPRVQLLRLLKAAKGPAPGAPYTLQRFQEDFGVEDAALWADVLALQGDSSDNVMGVKGIGEKMALALVQAYGDVERILAVDDYAVKLNKSQREMLGSAEGAAAARLSKQLVSLVLDLQAPPVRELDLGATRLGLPPQPDELRRLLAEYELQWVAKSLFAEYDRWEGLGGGPLVDWQPASSGGKAQQQGAGTQEAALAAGAAGGQAAAAALGGAQG